MTIATYPAPTTEVLAAARAEVKRRQDNGRPRTHPIATALRYAIESTVEINGLNVRMSLRTAIDVLKLTGQLGEYIPVAVGTDDIDRAEAKAEQERIFNEHCERMGLVDCRERAVSKCHKTGLTGWGWMTYAPDASGYPTPVMFELDPAAPAPNPAPAINEGA